MPDLSTLAGGAMQSGVNAAASIGVSVSDAALDTKGSWTELISATAYDTAWVLVTITNSSSPDFFLVDIGIGASTAEKVLIPDLHFDQQSITTSGGRVWLFPLAIPAGSRLSARCASNTTLADTTMVAITCIAAQHGSVPGFGRVEAFGVNATGSTGTSCDPGGTANTKAATPTQVIASTAMDYHWMCLTFTASIALTVSQSWLIDIMVGAGGSEKVVVPDLTTFGGSTSETCFPASVCFPVSIPAGSRVSVRPACSVNTASERNLLVSGQGVG